VSKDRRKAPRFESRLFVNFQGPNDGGQSNGRGVMVDVSRLGFAIDTESELEPGVVYDCHVEMPFALRAKVVRLYSRGLLRRYGMEIVSPSIIDRLLLRKLLKGNRFSKKV
jgi:hypothetical protein